MSEDKAWDNNTTAFKKAKPALSGFNLRVIEKLSPGLGLQRLLIIILPVVALSFYALGSLRSEPITNDTEPVVGNRISRSITNIPGKIEIKTTRPAAGPGSEQKTTAARGPEESAAATGTTAAVKSEASDSPETAAIVTTSQATIPKPAATAPTTTLAHVAEAEKTAEKIKVPPPRWQSLDENWDENAAQKAPKVDESNLSKSAWKQLELGQSENITVDRKSKSPTIAEIRAQSRKRAQKSKPKPKITTPEKKAAQAVKPKVKLKAKLKAKPKKSGRPRMAILNESGRAGMGETYRYVLAAMGFSAVLVEDKPKRNGITTVYHRPDLKKEAQRLLDRLPGPNRTALITWKSQFDLVILIR